MFEEGKETENILISFHKEKFHLIKRAISKEAKLFLLIESDLCKVEANPAGQIVTFEIVLPFDHQLIGSSNLEQYHYSDTYYSK